MGLINCLVFWKLNFPIRSLDVMTAVLKAGRDKIICSSPRSLERTGRDDLHLSARIQKVLRTEQ